MIYPFKNYKMHYGEVYVNIFPMDYYLSKIRRLSYFSMMKINHGHWEEYFYIVHGMAPTKGGYFFPEKNCKIWQPLNEMTQENKHLATDFIEWKHDIMSELAIINKTNSLDKLIAVSNFAHPGDHHRGGGKIETMIKKIIPDTFLHDGMLWKRSLIDKSIYKFFDCIKKFQILLIGPSHLKNLKHIKFDFIEININLAYKDRNDLKSKIISYREKTNGPLIILMQASQLAVWLILKLNLPETFIFDIGQAFDIFFPKEVPWVKNNLKNFDSWLRKNHDVL